MNLTKSQIENLSVDELKRAIKLATQIKEIEKFNKLDDYRPYTKQKQFHKLGRNGHCERLLMAGNQLGKSLCGSAEMAYHLTGQYPDWWEGAVFDKPPTMWAAGVTGESTRDNPQRLLVGPPANEEDWGSGFIRKDRLLTTNKAMGIKNLLDSVVVKWGGEHTSDKSLLYFKSYEKGAAKWQGPTLDLVWFDEEPPSDIYSEGRTRTQNGQKGTMTMITFTPLLGMSEVVRMFLNQKTDYPDEEIPETPGHHEDEEAEEIQAI